MVTLTYNGDCSEFSLQIFLSEHEEAIRAAAINAIEESTKNNLDNALVAEIIVEDDTIDFTLDREEWTEFLSRSIDPLLKKEEYETLVRVRELMRVLE